MNIPVRKIFAVLLVAVVFCITGCENIKSESFDNINFFNEGDKSFQASEAEIASAMKAEGYDNVIVHSHKIHYPDNGEEMGCVDEVYLDAEYTDPNNLFYISDYMGSLYGFWGESMGWINSYNELQSIKYDFSGFNGKYFKIIDNETVINLLRFFPEVIVEENSEIGVYVKFKNMEDLKYNGNHEFSTDRAIANLMIQYNGQTYETELHLCDEIILDSMDGNWDLEIYVEDRNTMETAGLLYMSNWYNPECERHGNFLQLISEEEYLADVSGLDKGKQMKGDTTDFLGVSGDYMSGIYKNSGNMTIYIDGKEATVNIGTFEMPEIIRKIPCEVISENVMIGECSWGTGCVFTFTWTAEDVVIVTRKGSTDNEILDSLTNGVEYCMWE